MKIVKDTVMLILVAGVAVIFILSDLYAQDPPPGMSPMQKPSDARTAKIPIIEKIGPGMFRMGDILISKKFQSVTFPALVNMDKGLLEYLIVRTDGKTHESLLRTQVQPSDLQLAFLLLGFEGTDRPIRGQGDPEKPKGEPVEVTIVINRDGKNINIKAEEWISKKVENVSHDIEKLDWVFTGSVFYNKRFMAQIEGSIVALYHDPVALVDNASVGGESDEIWFVKEGKVPPVGTPVTVTIKNKK